MLKIDLFKCFWIIKHILTTFSMFLTLFEFVKKFRATNYRQKQFSRLLKRWCSQIFIWVMTKCFVSWNDDIFKSLETRNECDSNSAFQTKSTLLHALNNNLKVNLQKQWEVAVKTAQIFWTFWSFNCATIIRGGSSPLPRAVVTFVAYRLTLN